MIFDDLSHRRSPCWGARRRVAEREEVSSGPSTTTASPASSPRAGASLPPTNSSPESWSTHGGFHGDRNASFTRRISHPRAGRLDRDQGPGTPSRRPRLPVRVCISSGVAVLLPITFVLTYITSFWNGRLRYPKLYLSHSINHEPEQLVGVFLLSLSATSWVRFVQLYADIIQQTLPSTHARSGIYVDVTRILSWLTFMGAMGTLAVPLRVSIFWHNFFAFIFFEPTVIYMLANVMVFDEVMLRDMNWAIWLRKGCFWTAAICFQFTAFADLCTTWYFASAVSEICASISFPLFILPVFPIMYRADTTQPLLPSLEALLCPNAPPATRHTPPMPRSHAKTVPHLRLSAPADLSLARAHSEDQTTDSSEHEEMSAPTAADMAALKACVGCLSPPHGLSSVSPSSTPVVSPSFMYVESSEDVGPSPALKMG
ncbi:unnamed protein product [Vitrella brassicaformis CCMP3155]|uniref:Uncharacterized protein n=1 Tax=Vitrella brassicaformis (strain CCMP3155) TaxID=1169540 RepID=A0A0G4EUP0_VITBC|nr:unnamed protein product [Vitrella brassicaformis CCMP3155]|mmetsp:Transcript_27123/g.67610  ORF Transcript_27123/g.67610 Transcript_27123/m.67610 type:complete len:429 (-) Transcript_27123:60-1346(-)|eukprot:CEM02041.1 unnamed protein product [Vitrella brassicaformis CCMP3155]